MNEARYLNVLVAVSDAGERDRIIQHLQKHPAARVLGGCGNADEITTAHRKTSLDILFLDMDLPPSGAFSFLRTWPGSDVPPVVFLAETDEHAIAAFQFHPLDYLLKPVSLDRLDEAIGRMAEQRHIKTGATGGNVVLEWVRNHAEAAVPAIRAAMGTLHGNTPVPVLPALRLMVKTAGRINFLRTEEIDYIEADRDYVRIHNGGRKHLLREKISRLEQQLPADRFLRIHRSTIVNIDRIKEMQPLCYGEYSVILHDGTRLTLSRSFRERVFSRLVTAA
jgi:two-component system, LytTR family, response regulator